MRGWDEGQGGEVSLYHSKNLLPLPSPPTNLGKMTIKAVLWPLGLCVLYYRNPCRYSFVSITNEKTEKENGLQSSKIDRR